MKPSKVGQTPYGKAPTGISGLDEITAGGFPRGTATLIEGGPGSGKTILALQSLVNGARQFGEPGIFLGFEEFPSLIMANAATFGWKSRIVATGEAVFSRRPAPTRPGSIRTFRSGRTARFTRRKGARDGRAPDRH